MSSLGGFGVALTPAGASTLPRSDSSTSGCDVAPPTIAVVNLDDFQNLTGLSPSQQEICGVWAMEDDAYATYAQSHGLPLGSPLIPQIGSASLAGLVWGDLLNIADVEENDPSVLSSDEAGAYDWLQQIVNVYEVAAAKDAINEYNSWNADPCGYAPPNTQLFNFSSSEDPACDKSNTISLLFGPTPPTYQEFAAYGTYDATKALGLTSALLGSKWSLPLQELVGEAAGIPLTLLGGAAPTAVINAISPSASQLLALLRQLPYNSQVGKLSNRYTTQLRKAKDAFNDAAKKVEDAEKAAAESEDGEEPDPALYDDLEAASDALEEAGSNTGDLASLAGADLGGPIAIVLLAATILATESVSISQAQQIPGQLQANLTTAEGAQVDDLLVDPSGAGYQDAFETFMTQVSITPPSDPTAPPPDGTAFEVDFLNTNGTGSAWQQTGTTANIYSWPMGPDLGDYDPPYSYGPPSVTLAHSGGLVWQTPDPDEAAAGITDYLPTGQINYFNPAGQPEMALVDGDQFITLSASGSLDAGGLDDGDDCQTAGECSVTNSIVAMAPNGGTAQLESVETGNQFLGSTCTGNDAGTDDCLTTTLVPDGELNPGSAQLERITLVADTGTPANVQMLNEAGAPASSQTGVVNGIQQGGLIAGQTVQVSDPAPNPLGYGTTYTWQIETKCAYNPTNPPVTVQGVPVCSGSPDYNASSLAADEQDLTSCTNGQPGACGEWTEDPAFHGDPVTTVSGQSLSWTWAAPGTYHVRLITSDTYGVTHQFDEDVTIAAGSAPTATLGVQASSSSEPQPSFETPSVIGPIENGDPITITGCIQAAELAYDSPQVTVNWGDGTSETQTAKSGGDSTLSFTYEPSTGCSSLWQFAATHDYNVSETSSDVVQVPITITLADGYGTTETINAYGDVSFAAAPQFTSPATTTFSVGTVGDFTVTANGVPTPTISASPATVSGCTAGLPSGIGIANTGEGTVVVSGAPSTNEGGCYAESFTASNSEGSASQTLTLNINELPSFSGGANASGVLTVGRSGSITITASGSPTPALSESGALPSGVTFTDNGNGTATISGTPAAGTAGVYELVVTASSGGGAAKEAYALTVASVPAITSAASAGFPVGHDATFTVTTSGSPAPSITESGPLDGLFFTDNGNGTATISGAASSAGSFAVTLTASNGAATSATQHFTITASATGGPTITVSGSGANESVSSNQCAAGSPPCYTAEVEVGESANISISSSNPTDTLQLNNGSPPPGLTFTAGAGTGSATISGTPSAPVDFSGWVTDNQSPMGLAFLTIEVIGGTPVFTSASSVTVTQGSPVNFKVTVGDQYLSSQFYLESSLPPGLSFTNTSLGYATITGTPTQAGSFSVTLEACNLYTSAPCGEYGLYPSGAQPGTQTLTITVVQVLPPASSSPPTITSADTAAFRQGAPESFTVTTNFSGATAPTISESGALPAGLTFGDNGNGTATISGTATTAPAASFPIVITATSPAGTAVQDFSLTTGPLPSFLSPATATFPATGGSFTVSASGTPVPSFALSGQLPAGLSFTDNGNGTATIAGTPAAGGFATVTITATNVYGSTSQQLTINTGAFPAFVGSASGLIPTCTLGFLGFPSPGPPTSSDTMQTLAISNWLLCASGSPTPSLTLSGQLPAGLSFIDNGNGTASISGTPLLGSGGSYPLTLNMTNGYGTATQSLTLVVDDAVEAASAPDAPTWAAGAENTYTMSASGEPVPSFSFCTLGCPSVPGWLVLHDNGDGTAVLSGSPPSDAVGTTVNVVVDESNVGADQFGSATEEPVTITIAPASFTAASPPPATVGAAYSYDFAASSSATFSVAPGDGLPPGLALSSAGMLSGVPTTVGYSSFAVVATTGQGSVTSPLITFEVGAKAHSLEISQFRVLGPNGAGDWFVQLYNPNASAISLSGWSVGVTVPGLSSPLLIPLGSGTIAAAGTVVVAGPFFSDAALTPIASGPSYISDPGGFDVVAPDGTITDLAGEASSGLYAGTGVTAPALTSANFSGQQGFVRSGLSNGAAVDTDDNAADFQYGPLVAPVAPAITSAPQATAVAGAPFSYSVTGTGSPAPSYGETGTLPSGVTFSSAGVLSGTPAPGTVGTYEITITATNSLGSATQVFVLSVNSPSAATTTTVTGPTSGTYGHPQSYTAVATPSDGGGSLSFYLDGSQTPLTGCSNLPLAQNGTIILSQAAAGSVTETLTFTASVQDVTITSGATTATVASGGFPVAPSVGVSGAGIPPGTTVSAVSGNTITLSNAATASATETLTFTTSVPGVTITSGETTATVASSFAGVASGEQVSGTDIPTGTTVTSFGEADSADCAVSGMTAGSHTISATYSGDTSYAGSSGSLAVTVGQAPLTITASSPSMTYGGSVPSISASYSGFVNGDTASSLTTAPACSTAATSSSPVGSYAANCSGAVDSNYAISYDPGSVTVGQAPLTITASSPSMTYGGSVPSISASYSGFVNGDTASSLTKRPSCSSNVTARSPVGTYASGCSGAVDPNYTISYVPGTLTVSPATLAVAANAQSRNFGQANPNLTVTISGFVNGQSLANSGVTGSASCQTTATVSSPPGTYPITCTLGTLAATNYTFSPPTPALLTVGATTTVSKALKQNETLTAGESLAVVSGGSLTGNVSVTNGAGFVMTGGAVNGSLTATGGIVELACASGGTFDGNLTLSGDATLLIAGCSLDGNATLEGDATFEMSGGALNGNVTALGSQTPTITITGGTVSGNVTGVVAPVSISGATIGGNVTTVGPLTIGSRAVVKGNVDDFAGATVSVTGATIGGNLTAQFFTTSAEVCGTSIAGNLQIQQGAGSIVIGGPSGSSCAPNTIKGDLSVDNTVTSQITVDDNTVSGNLTVQQNVVSAAPIEVTDNTVYGNLVVTDNRWATPDVHPVAVVAGNIVAHNLICQGNSAGSSSLWDGHYLPDTPGGWNFADGHTFANTVYGESVGPGAYF